MFSNFIWSPPINSWSVTSTKTPQRYRDYRAFRFACRSLTIFGTIIIYQTAVGSFQISALQRNLPALSRTEHTTSKLLCCVRYPPSGGPKIKACPNGPGSALTDLICLSLLDLPAFTKTLKLNETPKLESQFMAQQKATPPMAARCCQGVTGMTHLYILFICVLHDLVL